MHITDIIGDKKNIFLLNNFLNKKFQDKSLNVIDFFCTNLSLINYLRREGWFSVIDEESVYCPHLYYPIEKVYPPTTSIAIYSRINNLFQVDLFESYITKKECSLDLPTPHTFS